MHARRQTVHWEWTTSVKTDKADLSGQAFTAIMHDIDP